MKKKYNIQGMSCAACQAHVQKAVEKVIGVKTVNVNLLQNNMVVEFDESICNDNLITEAVDIAGYKAIPTDKKTPVSNNIIKAEKDNKLVKLLASIAILIVLMYISMGNMMLGFKVFPFIDHHQNPMGFALAQFLLVIPICLINKNYFISGFDKLLKGHPNMDSLIAIGASFSLAYGIFALFMISYASSMIVQSFTNGSIQIEYYKNMIMEYHDSLYFESAAMILTLVSVGKYLESLSKKKTTKAIEKLMDLSAKKAVVLREGKEVTIDASEVALHDIVVAKRGTILPVDGIIVSGQASIDQANITGESMPVEKKKGEEVYSSTTVSSGYIQVEATKVGDNTTIANIIKLVEEASNSKAPISKLADKVSAVFVPAIFSIAFITFIVNLLLGSPFQLALNFAVTVIVIACPCALGLATPVAIMVGCGKGAENGLLIKNAEILEKAHSINTVVLDKTGTITLGAPEVTHYQNFSNDSKLLDIVTSIEKKSEHPLALAIINYGQIHNAQEVEIESFDTIDGRGLIAFIKEDLYYVGNIKYAIDEGINTSFIDPILEERSRNGETPLIIIKNEDIVGVIACKDVVKPTSKEAIYELKKQGIEVVMLTGDNALCANKIAEEVGVTKVISDVFPTDKAKVIESLKGKDKTVAMVGDGVNDALALASADLGISIGSGSEVALETSDIVLLHNDLMDVSNVIHLSKKTLNTIKINLFWAFFYNAVCVIIATGILYYTPLKLKINPMYGSVAMSISSVSVVLNALTINLFKAKKSINNVTTKAIENLSTQLEEEYDVVTLKVDKMMCSHCTARVEKCCLEDEHVKSAIASLEKKEVVIKYKGIIDLSTIKRKITDAGYIVK